MLRKVVFLFVNLIMAISFAVTIHKISLSPADGIPVRIYDMERPILMLNGYLGDPLTDPPKTFFKVKNENITTSLYLVQFDRPVTQEDADLLKNMNAKVYAYFPFFTYLVSFENSARSVKPKANISSHIRWMGKYYPEYKLARNLVINNSPVVNYEYVKVLSVNSLKNKFNVVNEEVGFNDLYVSEIKIKGVDLQELVSDESVIYVQPKEKLKYANDKARGIVNVEDYFYIPIPPMFSKNPYERFLRGSTITFCVADSGLETGDATSLSEDFRYYVYDPSSTTFPYLKEVDDISRVTILDIAGDNDASDHIGHGTHVAGSLIGCGYNSGTYGSKDGVVIGGYAGMAPSGNLIFLAAGYGEKDALTKLSVGAALAPKADIYSESWGDTLNPKSSYTTNAFLIDSIIWNDPSKIVFFAAGNDGVDKDVDGKTDYYTLSPEGTAKNAITVGASENLRSVYDEMGNEFTYGMFDYISFPSDPIYSDGMGNNENGVAAFSGRGPTLDYRIKPDILAPGTNVVSVRAGSSNLPAFDPDGKYALLNGTSFATPIAAGCMGILEEYIKLLTNNGISSLPSYGAKALFLTMADDMYPGQYSDYPEGKRDTEIPYPGTPSPDEGWGRVDVGNFLIDENGFQVNGDAVIDLYFSSSDATDPAQNGIGFGETLTYSFTVDKVYDSLINKYYPIKILLAWNDAPGIPGTGGLVNDLDMYAVAPNGDVFYPTRYVGEKLNYESLLEEKKVSFENSDGTWERVENNQGITSYFAVISFDSYPVTLQTLYFGFKGLLPVENREYCYVNITLYENADPQNTGAKLTELKNVKFTNSGNGEMYSVTLTEPILIMKDCIVKVSVNSNELGALIDTNTNTPYTYEVINGVVQRILDGNFMVRAEGFQDTSIEKNNDGVPNYTDNNSEINGYYVKISAPKYPAYLKALSFGLKNTAPSSIVPKFNLKIYLHSDNPENLGGLIYDKDIEVKGFSEGFYNISLPDIFMYSYGSTTPECIAKITFLDNYLSGLIDTDTNDGSTWKILSNGGYVPINDGNFMCNMVFSYFPGIKNVDILTNCSGISGKFVLDTDSYQDASGYGFMQLITAPKDNNKYITPFFIKEIRFGMEFNPNYKIGSNVKPKYLINIFKDPQFSGSNFLSITSPGTLVASYEFETDMSKKIIKYELPQSVKIDSKYAVIEVVCLNNFDYSFATPETIGDFLFGKNNKGYPVYLIGVDYDPSAYLFKNYLLLEGDDFGDVYTPYCDVKVNYEIPEIGDEFFADKFNNVEGIWIPKPTEDMIGKWQIFIRGYNVPYAYFTDDKKESYSYNASQIQFALAIRYHNQNNGFPSGTIPVPQEPPIHGDKTPVSDWMLYVH